MRYSEAIQKLEKDPTLQFTLKETYKTWTLKTDYDPRFPRDESLYFMLECEGEDSMDGAGEFSGNLLMSDERWEVVRHPVTWQEAIQELANGKRIRCEFHNQSWDVAQLVENYLYFRKALDVGKWYVED